MRRANVRHTRSLDTPDIDFNPVTGRFEVVRSCRERLLVDLWCIHPQDWESSEWRYEGVLFAKKGSEGGREFKNTSGGFHPGGGVIDAEKGVRHVFIYTGPPRGPAGSFRLTRTLDTPKLVEFLSGSSSSYNEPGRLPSRPAPHPPSPLASAGQAGASYL